MILRYKAVVPQKTQAETEVDSSRDTHSQSTAYLHEVGPQHDVVLLVQHPKIFLKDHVPGFMCRVSNNCILKFVD